jgi:DNA-3-methyladenine glycosylase II
MSHQQHLSKDKRLKKAVQQLSVTSVKPLKHLHVQLCYAVIGQQLSTRVATVIKNRFIDLFDVKNPTPQHICSLKDEQLRSIGLSASKTTYIKNICLFFLENKITDKKLYALDDESVIQTLTQIKGIGRWSVEMLLMFSMARPDVFSVDDYGIQKAMSALYNWDMSDKKAFKEKMLKASAKWSPYRSFACRYLWLWNDHIVKSRK